MSDPRLTLVLDGLAAAGLEGLVAAERYAPTKVHRCVVPVAAIRDGPHAPCEQHDQLVFGEAFDVLAQRGGFLFGQARRDGYVGWVDAACLEAGPGELPTHWVKAPATYAFSAADIKAPPRMRLTMNSLVTVGARQSGFAHAEDAGWIYEGHLAPIGEQAADPVTVAGGFMAAPYQWGGREAEGLDCSGLVQQGFYAAGIAVPRDTDMQGALGVAVEDGKLTRGDLVFWPGHVGIMLDRRRMLHANAFHMATAVEVLAQAVARIGPPTGYRRI